jgi:hypothetical protein
MSSVNAAGAASRWKGSIDSCSTRSDQRLETAPSNIAYVARVASGTAAGAPVVATLTAAVPVGDTIVLAARSDDPAISSAVDSQGNAWTVDTTLTEGSVLSISLLRCKVTNALAIGDTITLTPASSTTVYWAAFQFTGASTIDQTSTAGDVSGSLTTLSSNLTPTSTGCADR